MAITKLNSLAIPDNTIVEADLSYPLTNFSSTGIDDNASSTAVTIDSGQRVGIGTLSPARNLSIVDASAPHIQLAKSADQAASNGFEIAFDGSANYIAGRENVPTVFYTNNTERMRLNPIGRLGLGTTPSTPETLLDIKADGTIQGSGIGAINVRPHYGGGKFFNALRCAPSSTASDVLGAGLHIGAIDKDNALITSGNFYNSAGYYYNSHTTASAIALGGGQVVFYGNTGLTAGTYTYLPTTLAAFDGDGLKFNGDTATANALDDYEEGTWTPAANNLTVNYSSVVSSGSYVKIGKLVTATFAIQWSSANVGAGYAALNLPIVSSTDYGSGILIEVDQAPVSIDQLSMYTTSGQSLIYFRKRNAGGVSSICARTDLFTGSNRISGTITYYAS